MKTEQTPPVNEHCVICLKAKWTLSWNYLVKTKYYLIYLYKMKFLSSSY